jgi:hypothetical protein
MQEHSAKKQTDSYVVVVSEILIVLPHIKVVTRKLRSQLEHEANYI